MSSTTHIDEANLSEIKDFEFVSMTETMPLSFYARHQRNERAHATAQSSVPFDAFHEEFKSLVLAGGEPSQENRAAESYVELFDPRELEWDSVPERAASNRPSPLATSVAVKDVARQQVVRPIAGPRVGTPVPIETWVVKVIAVLVGLNLLFAGMIVSGVRVSDLFQ